MCPSRRPRVAGLYANLLSTWNLALAKTTCTHCLPNLGSHFTGEIRCPRSPATRLITGSCLSRLLGKRAATTSQTYHAIRRERRTRPNAFYCREVSTSPLNYRLYPTSSSCTLTAPYSFTFLFAPPLSRTPYPFSDAPSSSPQTFVRFLPLRRPSGRRSLPATTCNSNDGYFACRIHPLAHVFPVPFLYRSSRL